jgi:hypothetical protein
MDHGANAFIGEKLIYEDSLLESVEYVDARDTAVAGLCSGEQEIASIDIFRSEYRRHIRGADCVGGLTVNEDSFAEESDDFGYADSLCEIYDFIIKRAGSGGVDDGGLAAGKDVFYFAGGEFIGDGKLNAGGHDLAF